MSGNARVRVAEETKPTLQGQQKMLAECNKKHPTTESANRECNRESSLLRDISAVRFPAQLSATHLPIVRRHDDRPGACSLYRGLGRHVVCRQELITPLSCTAGPAWYWKETMNDLDRKFMQEAIDWADGLPPHKGKHSAGWRHNSRRREK